MAHPILAHSWSHLPTAHTIIPSSTTRTPSPLSLHVAIPYSHPPPPAPAPHLHFLITFLVIHLQGPHKFPHLSFPPSPSFTQRVMLIFVDPWQQNTLFSSPLADPVTLTVNLLLSSGPDLSQIHFSSAPFASLFITSTQFFSPPALNQQIPISHSQTSPSKSTGVRLSPYSPLSPFFSASHTPPINHRNHCASTTQTRCHRHRGSHPPTHLLLAAPFTSPNQKPQTPAPI
ncbi:unnamed protein product [Sphenostylis stenocarpa]|uniref:Uncharacterized protein n=1 Tax=Sphenostylis stenocarpa TaxID=92480 RepID=A0AA86VFF1_9FABA|nr:unnamed protein product [Sphenostylis stenocarpa]